MRFPRLALATLAVSLVVLTGCAGQTGTPVETTAPPVADTPTATSKPSASAAPDPEPEALIISTAGLDAVKLNAPVPADLAIATWDPKFCPGGEGAFALAGSKYEDGAEYVIRTKDFDEKSDVETIIVYDEDILTPSGVHVGMSLKEVRKILPQMERVGEPNDLASLWVVEDDLGQLVFEFAEGDELKDIKSLANSVKPFGIWFTDSGGPCPV